MNIPSRASDAGPDTRDTYSPDGPVCENCGTTVERLTLVPQFDYMGCDDCMVEALAVIDAETGCTEAEMRKSPASARVASIPMREVA